MDVLRQRARSLRKDMTDAERALWRVLRGRQIEGFRFRRQVPIGGYIADFICPQAKLIVEVDGGQHADAAAYDAARTAKLQGLGYRVLRFWNHDVLLRTLDVGDAIYRELTKGFTPPQPSPSLREREGATARATARTTGCCSPSLSRSEGEGRGGVGS